MKFLVNKFHIIIFFVISNILLASECIDIWYKSNSAKIQKDNILINAIAYPALKKNDVDSLKIYIDKIDSKIKIESSNEILMFDREKSMRVFKEKEYLYIDKPDSSIFIFLSSILNLENIVPVRKSKFEYRLKLDSNFNKTKLFFSENCFFLNSIHLSIDKLNIIIKDINFDSYNILDSMDVFDIHGDYLIYDLR